MILSNKSFKDRFYELYWTYKRLGETDADAQVCALDQIVREVGRTHVLYNHCQVEPLIK